MGEKNKKTAMRIDHPIPPLYDEESRILILGSFPSVKSREAAFFYGHPQNRFWRLMATLLSEEFPGTVEERSAMLHRNHVALWDSIASCEIVGSSDSSIRNVVPNDLSVILDHGEIKTIYCNGSKSHEYYQKYIRPKTGIEAVKLPSTSPANATWKMERLLAEWRQILTPLQIAPPEIGKDLLSWYDHNARILPWREDPSPYHVWISEIMLQQTRVEAVKEYYQRWMEELPDVEALSKVPDDKLMKLWEGLGYYRRARHLKEAALDIMDRFDGEIPGDYRELLSLKGIGEYSAGAIASIAFGLPRAAVDGNVLRVFARILGEPGKITQTKIKKKLERETLRVMPEDRPGDYNQALMDLGATVCLPNGQPLCDRCPWENICQAHRLGKECEYPVKGEKKPRRIEGRTVLLLEYRDRILLHRREPEGLLAGLWEFPALAGRLTADKIREEMGSRKITDYDIISLGEGKHVFSHVEWHMRGYRLRLHHMNAAIEDLLARKDEWVMADAEEMEKSYALPSAFDCFRKNISVVEKADDLNSWGN